MPVTYESWLVLLSIGMAIQGAYVGLSLAVQVVGATGLRRRLLLAGAAASLAVAIWTMHFVGMLALRVPFQVDYLVFPTLLSFLVCVIVVGAAIYATSSGPLTMVRLTLSSCLMGGGIFTMHYIGMSALSASAYMIHDRVFVAASMTIAIAASGLTLWLAAGRGRRPPLILSAIAFGIAVSGMHYTAMEGLTLLPFASATASAPALSTDLLAIVVSIVAFCVSGIFLLVLMPETPRIATPQAIAMRGDGLAPATAPALAAEISGADQPAANRHDKSGGFIDKPMLAGASDARADGAEILNRRYARHLPIERDGAVHLIAVEDVVAVHANAHYTYIFNGSDKLFCPLAIGDVESRLDDKRFVRIHRSHIVNIDRVVGYKKSGDNELVEMAAAQVYAVPVSRSRIGWLKTRIASLTGGNAASHRRRQHLAPQ